ncbi:hypothetical protein VCRA2121O391_120118 [Vibrio crassostreae]|nr:hypothetical protein VCRA2117O378_130008 [Vibrio crassostreae]CAK1763415.1 hypothetical protein VCRA2113O356_140008 [Vibrio crassostreae]CAK2193952.1 hypothetical protein VCRA2113O351_70046 [Vibrio crassostreae]CAK2284657.1 hypothetical protein VCRA2119O386_130008 [Vibrio crassostreae]CAK2558653.1 hypothetical protein VCRA2117O375_130119 [Vibrio crassostreae]
MGCPNSTKCIEEPLFAKKTHSKQTSSKFSAMECPP